MHQLRWDKYPDAHDKDLLPCEYFDLIGGSDTGGYVPPFKSNTLKDAKLILIRLIAIMLVKLRMSVDETLHEFSTIVDQVYVNKLEPAEKTRRLKECMEALLTKKNLPIDLKLEGDKQDGHQCLGYVDPVFISSPFLTIYNTVDLLYPLLKQTLGARSASGLILCGVKSPLPSR